MRKRQRRVENVREDCVKKEWCIEGDEITDFVSSCTVVVKERFMRLNDALAFQLGAAKTSSAVFKISKDSRKPSAESARVSSKSCIQSSTTLDILAACIALAHDACRRRSSRIGASRWASGEEKVIFRLVITLI
jgi:hypothetical protein